MGKNNVMKPTMLIVRCLAYFLAGILFATVVQGILSALSSPAPHTTTWRQ